MRKQKLRNFVTCTYYVTPEIAEATKRLVYDKGTTVAAFIRAFLVSEIRKAKKEAEN